ncbi:Protein of unknown function [Pyronema omphalodes CBS 100304]|uniref:Uncharacterized protein n=1 Tax=Pyronema omphalodes (strain CBS 100304) TaxID=1076935 RepID=U4LCM8_PYROM|nr:Protein of unknown function [Pyronema omphalodes CBS 100304]
MRETSNTGLKRSPGRRARALTSEFLRYHRSERTSLRSSFVRDLE